MTAAELGPAGRLLGWRGRGRSSGWPRSPPGCCCCWTPTRLTGRLPLEVQVQASRLRHAVKLVIQAEAARSPAHGAALAGGAG